MKILTFVFCSALISACSNQSGSTVYDTRTDACDTQYYKQVIGEYKGLITLDVHGRYCEWDTDVRIYNSSSSPHGCLLDAEISSKVQQLTSASDNGFEYQCHALNSVRSVYEGNSSFPLSIDFQFIPIVEQYGPTGAINIYLIDGVNTAVRTTTITDKNRMLIGGNGLNGTLIKEAKL